MELKSQFNLSDEQIYPSSNRTFMELKFVFKNFADFVNLF